MNTIARGLFQLVSSLEMPFEGFICTILKDQDGISYPNGLGWSSSLAYGSELRVAGIGDYPESKNMHIMIRIAVMIMSHDNS